MIFSPEALQSVLEAQLPPGATGMMVALSGGADSACLLAALARMDPRALRHLPVRAVHVDHGLQPEAADFSRACEELCRRFGVPLAVVAVRIADGGGVSIEAAAREARYQALALQLRAGECLLTAHHADDQAETVLLQLLRGTGIKGLAAMPSCRAWHGGWHLRPLLPFARRELRSFGEGQGVTGVPDPMNGDLRFDRAYLRETLWPGIEARWPGAALALSRTARHAADAQELLDRTAARAVEKLRDGNALSVPGLRALSTIERVNAIRYWIAGNGAEPPSTARLTEALRQAIASDDDHLPVVVWGGHALRRYRNRLFLTNARPSELCECGGWAVSSQANLDLGAGLGRLHWSPLIGGLDADRLPAMLEVRRRRGGESLRPQRRASTQSLQHLCQSLGVLPWMRDALPLVYAGRHLVAVGDLWQDARWCVAPGAPGYGCVWQDAPILV